MKPRQQYQPGQITDEVSQQREVPHKAAYKGDMNHSQFEENIPVEVCAVEEKKVNLGLYFQFCNVKKALIAVKRICEKGIKFHLGQKKTISSRI